MTPSLSQLFVVFGRIGVLSFGGPAAQIALMHDALVARHKWLSEQEYLRALSLCMLLPGPEAMQLATYAGWRMRGAIGGLFAGLLFVMPGALVILALAVGYASFGDLPLVQAAFLGIKAAVIVVVLQALLRLSQKALRGFTAWALAAGAFAALFCLGVPFPVIVIVAGVYGYISRLAAATPPALPAPRGADTLRTIALYGSVWAAPFVVLYFAAQDFLLQIAVFFSKLAVVTFGGAYAVLAYMTQEVVQNYGWITTAEMIDALGLAETTPGPLILVTQFVALLAGFAQGGVGLGLAAGAVALWVTFVPCFLWIFAAGPYLDHIAARPRLSAALEAITAAVVGVILNLSLWFALHVLFEDVGSLGAMPWPDVASLNLPALGLFLLALVLMLWVRLPLLAALLVMALAGCGVGILGLI